MILAKVQSIRNHIFPYGIKTPQNLQSKIKSSRTGKWVHFCIKENNLLNEASEHAL